MDANMTQNDIYQNRKRLKRTIFAGALVLVLITGLFTNFGSAYAEPGQSADSGAVQTAQAPGPGFDPHITGEQDDALLNSSGGGLPETQSGDPFTMPGYDVTVYAIWEIIDCDDTGHDWGAWIETTPARCTEGGEESRFCSRDSSHVETRPIGALGHDYHKVGSLPATCELDGYTDYECGNDITHVYRDPNPSLDHDWGAWTTTTPATCTAGGVETSVCSRDSSHVQTRPIDPLGHDYGAWTMTTPATCILDGVESRVCRHDPAHAETRPIDALGHDWGDPKNDPLWQTRSHPPQNESGHPLVGGTYVQCQRTGCMSEKEHMPLYTATQYKVIYFGNGNTGGTAPADTAGNAPAGTNMYSKDSAVKVLNRGTLSKSGFNFIGWNTKADGKGTSYSAGATFLIAQDTELFAVWRKAPVTPPPANPEVSGPNPPPPLIIDPEEEEEDEEEVPGGGGGNGGGGGGGGGGTSGGNGGGSGGGTESGVNTGMTETVMEPEIPEAADIDPIISAGPMLSIGGVEIPLFAGGANSAWAFVNLVLALLGILFALITFLRILMRRREENEETGTVYVSKNDEDEEEKKKRRTVWLILMTVLAAAGIILFLLTQDMRLPIALFDMWTITNAVIFIVLMIASNRALNRKGDIEEEDNLVAYNT